MEAMIRLRMGVNDAHYAGDLVDGARILKLFGDVATELLIRHDGDEGVLFTYDSVKFTAPVYAGDYIEAVGRLTEVGNTSRKMEFEARKVITASKNAKFDSAAEVLPEPLIVCQARGVCVVKAEKQRKLAEK